jgi:hypothetical protein
MKYQTIITPEIIITSNDNQQSFHDFILEVIDGAFSKLGTETRQALYSILQKEYSLNKNDLPDKLEDFVNALENVFGASALLVEIDILKRIKTKAPLFMYIVQNADLYFDEYLSSLKNYMQTCVFIKNSQHS